MLPVGLVDYSSAAPWLISGIIAGILLYALVRALLGIDRRRIASLRTAELELKTSRLTSHSLSEQAAQLDTERNHLTAQVAELSPRAQTASLLEQQVTTLKRSDAARQEALDIASKQITELQEHAETHTSTAKYYESQYASLFAEHDALGKQSKDATSEIGRIKTDLANAKSSLASAAKQSDEMTTAKTEIASLRNELANANASLGSYKKQQSDDLVTAKAEITSLRSELAKSSTAAGDLVKLSSEFNAATSAHQAEMARLKSETEGNGNTGASSLAVEASKLRSELAAAKTRDAEREAEIAKLKVNAATVTQGGIDPELYESDVAALRSTTDDLRKELAKQEAAILESRKSMEESSMLAAQRHTEIEQLKAQLASGPGGGENYKRFKDALEAANRIAAGLPPV